MRPVSAPKGHLPRLARIHYQGRAVVHWTFTLDRREPLLACERTHHRWQTILLHACARHHLVAPLYVLMPDHAHVLRIGLSSDSDQWLAANFLRRHTRAALAPRDWQKQTHDHVLRENERTRGALASIAHYICENPRRAGLVEDWRAYPYIGSCVPGYPELDPRAEDYWTRFWRCHHYLADKPSARPAALPYVAGSTSDPSEHP
jgi:REP element-mobilizing transposase RayT